MPWRNGQGMTTEIAAGGAPSGAAYASRDFAWRVSLAEVTRSGDFSLFPGLDRIIMLVNGSGMTLHLPSQTQVLRPDEPFAFDGGLAVRCTVDEPTLDLNVMTRRGSAVGRLEVRHLSERDDLLVVPGAATGVLVVLDGAARASGVEGGHLESGDIVVTDEPLTVTGHGRIAVVTID